MVWLLLIFVFLLLLIIIFLSRLDKANLYKARELLTENEKEFFNRLILALPNHYVFPQVALGAILEPNARKNTRKFWRARASFSQKIADYVVCDNDLKIVAIIELDDRTHNQGKDQKRDAMLDKAGYRVIRWKSKSKPDIEQIQNKLKDNISD